MEREIFQVEGCAYFQHPIPKNNPSEFFQFVGGREVI